MNSSKMNIAITGISGYLGSCLAKNLVKEHRVFGLKRKNSDCSRIKDLSDIVLFDVENRNLEDLFKKIKIDVVIHCATCYGRSGETFDEIMEANVIFPLKVISTAEKHGVKFFINSDTVLNKFTSTYSLSKKQFLEWRNNFKKINFVNVQLEHFYGPGDSDKKFVTRMIHSLIRNEQEIKLTSGKQKREFLYIDDIVNAYDVVLKNLSKLSGESEDIVVSSDEKISIREFVDLLKSSLGNTKTFLNFGAIESRPEEVKPNCRRKSLLESYGWKALYSISQGIKETVKIEKQLNRNQ